MIYKEPEELLDTNGDLDWLFEEHGKVMTKDNKALPPSKRRHHPLLIHDYGPAKHLKEIKDNVQWRGYPEEHQIVLCAIIKKYFDVFVQEGMQDHVRDFKFNVDTGKVKPICGKQPQYRPHESRVINMLVARLEGKVIIEDNGGPWGLPIVLASKPDQAHVHWSELIFCLYVSYRAINAVTRPFTFPTTLCNKASKILYHG
jgi:hypothetical protein